MDPNQRVGGPCLLAVLLLGFSVCVLFCAGNGGRIVVEVPMTLVLGWASYLRRVVPQLNPDPWAVGTAVLCLTVFTLGSHAFLKWLYAATSAEPRRWRWKWTGLLVGLVVLLFTAGIAVIGMVHQTSWILRSPEPIVRSSRDAVPRLVSGSNLRQMGLATHNFHDAERKLPQVQFSATGQAMHSWQTMLLPYMEQTNVYSQIDLKKPWTDPANAQPMRQPIKAFWNPGASTGPLAVNGHGVSHYAANVHVVMGDTPRTLQSFSAGGSNTILAGEVSGNFRAWGDPLNVRDPKFGTTGHPQGFGGPGGRPAQFLMLDASVRRFDPKELADLLAMPQQ